MLKQSGDADEDSEDNEVGADDDDDNPEISPEKFWRDRK